jgi:hypothetical protein
MKKCLNFKSLVSISLGISFLFTFVSCDKEPVDERPELPPIESLVMDFSNFSEPPGGMKGTTKTYENFYHSYFSVLFWNVATTVTMALPVVAYGHALQQTPVYLGDRTWEWSFNFPLNNQNYTAMLTGSRISNEEFSMEMVIAMETTPDQGEKWFDGVVRYDHTHAAWNLYKDGSVKVLEAEWNKDFETEEADLAYTYVKTGKEETGSYIKLEYMPEELYDAAYTISLAANETIIQWNTTTIEGRVKDLKRFEDSQWHCWDSAAEGLADKVCD